MDCRTARQLIEFARPRKSELDADESDALRDHLSDCPMCRGVAENDWQVDEEFSLAMQDVKVPVRLREQLMVGLREARSTWYRRTVLASTAAAAAAVLAVTFGWSMWHRLNAEANFPPVVVEWTDSVRNQVEQWFREHHRLIVLAPPQFDYSLLKERRLADLDGKSVPYLRFEWGDHWAKVYILSDSDRIPEIEKPAGTTLHLIHHPTHSDVVYLVIYTGGHLERFLENQGQHAV
jgi:hypothetical protein